MADERPERIDRQRVQHTASHDFVGGVTKNGNDLVDATTETPQTDADHVSRLVDSPNGHVPNSILDDTERVRITVIVPDGETLKVYRWGGYQVTDGTAPTGLDVELLDGSDTVQSTANTVDNESTDPSSPVASHANSSGSESVFSLALKNDTGSTISSPGASAHFAYVVE